MRSGVRFSEARQQETLLTYQQTIQQAFREFRTPLVEYRKDRSFESSSQQLALSAQTRRDCLRCAIEAAPPATWRTDDETNYLMLSWDSLRPIE